MVIEDNVRKILHDYDTLIISSLFSSPKARYKAADHLGRLHTRLYPAEDIIEAMWIYAELHG